MAEISSEESVDDSDSLKKPLFFFGGRIPSCKMILHVLTLLLEAIDFQSANQGVNNAGYIQYHKTCCTAFLEHNAL